MKQRVFHDGQVDLYFEAKGKQPIRRTIHPAARESHVEAMAQKGYTLVREQPHLRELAPNAAVQSDEFLKDVK